MEISRDHAEELMRRYSIVRTAPDKIGVPNGRNLSRDVIADITAHKALILAIIAEADRRPEDVIDGLAILDAAISRRRAYDEAVAEATERCAYPLPTAPTDDIDAIRAQYPAAAAYVRARAEASRHNCDIAACGRRACNAIMADPSAYASAIQTMEAELDKAVKVWD